MEQYEESLDECPMDSVKVYKTEDTPLMSTLSESMSDLVPNATNLKFNALLITDVRSTQFGEDTVIHYATEDTPINSCQLSVDKPDNDRFLESHTVDDVDDDELIEICINTGIRNTIKKRKAKKKPIGDLQVELIEKNNSPIEVANKIEADEQLKNNKSDSNDCLGEVDDNRLLEEAINLGMKCTVCP